MLLTSAKTLRYYRDGILWKSCAYGSIRWESTDQAVTPYIVPIIQRLDVKLVIQHTTDWKAKFDALQLIWRTWDKIVPRPIASAIWSCRKPFSKLLGDRLNIKMSSYQYSDPRVKDKTVSRRSYLNMRIAIPGKDGLYIETAPMKALLHRRPAMQRDFS